MFFFTGLLFWARVIDPGPLRPRIAWPARIAYAAGAMVIGWGLAVTLVLMPSPIYPHYAALAHRPGGISALTDQQLAGGVMWVLGSISYHRRGDRRAVSLARARGAAAPPRPGDPDLNDDKEHAMPIVFADNFLAGSIISLLFPTLLLLAIVVFFALDLRRWPGRDSSRAPQAPARAEPPAPAPAPARLRLRRSVRPRALRDRRGRTSRRERPCPSPHAGGAGRARARVRGARRHWDRRARPRGVGPRAAGGRPGRRRRGRGHAPRARRAPRPGHLGGGRGRRARDHDAAGPDRPSVRARLAAWAHRRDRVLRLALQPSVPARGTGDRGRRGATACRAAAGQRDGQRQPARHARPASAPPPGAGGWPGPPAGTG